MKPARGLEPGPRTHAKDLMRFGMSAVCKQAVQTYTMPDALAFLTLEPIHGMR